MHGGLDGDVDHCVFRVTLRDGEQYAIDLTGAQYGQDCPVCTWDTCISVLDAEVLEILPFGSAVAERTADAQKLDKMMACGEEVTMNHSEAVPYTHY